MKASTTPAVKKYHVLYNIDYVTPSAKGEYWTHEDSLVTLIVSEDQRAGETWALKSNTCSDFFKLRKQYLEEPSTYSRFSDRKFIFDVAKVPAG